MPVQRFSDLVRFARDCSPFYADLYADLPPEVNSLTDLPVVDQNAFWAANTLHDNRVLTAPWRKPSCSRRAVPPARRAFPATPGRSGASSSRRSAPASSTRACGPVIGWPICSTPGSSTRASCSSWTRSHTLPWPTCACPSAAEPPGVDGLGRPGLRRPRRRRHADHPVPARRAPDGGGPPTSAGGAPVLRWGGALLRPASPPRGRVPQRRTPFARLRQRRRRPARQARRRPGHAHAPAFHPAHRRGDPRRDDRRTDPRGGPPRAGRRHPALPQPHARHPLPRRRPRRVDRHRRRRVPHPGPCRGRRTRRARLAVLGRRHQRCRRSRHRRPGHRHATRRTPLGGSRRPHTAPCHRPRARPGRAGRPGQGGRHRAERRPAALPRQRRHGIRPPLGVEWTRHRDLVVNSRSGKLVRVLDERPTA